MIAIHHPPRRRSHPSQRRASGYARRAARLAATIALCLAPAALPAQEATEHDCPPPMDAARLGGIVHAIDETAVERREGFWRFAVGEIQVVAITDEDADRMRVMAGIARVEDLEPGALERVLQANFDSALDARYAIAHGVLWSAYVHPLSSLDDEHFVSGVSQVVNLVATYGTSYSSGGLLFGGGDSAELIEELREREGAI